MRKILLSFLLLFLAITTQAQNFGEFIVNSHIDSVDMQILYDNCDSLGITPVFHYFYSDDTLQNVYSEVRRRHVSQGFLPGGMINGTPIMENSLYDIDKWIPLLKPLDSYTVEFDVQSNMEYLNPQDAVLNFNLINLQNLNVGDIIHMALVEDIGDKKNVQVKMNSELGTVYNDQKTINLSIIWPKNAILDNCNVVIWVELKDKTVLFSKEVPVENEYVNQEPVIGFNLTSNGKDSPTTLNWFFIDLTSSTDYEDNINDEVLKARIKWEDFTNWTEIKPVTETFSYRFRNAGTYNPIIELIDSDGAIISDTTETLIINWMTGIDNMYLNTGINIYPNPTTDILNIKSENLIKSIKVMDMTGKILLVNEQINNILFELETTSLQSGIYFINVIHTDKNLKDSTIRFIVK